MPGRASAAFSADGKRIVAFGDAGMAIHHGAEGWRICATPPFIRAVRCVRYAGDGSIIVGGAESLAARIFRDGTAEKWPSMSAGTPIFRGMEISSNGITTFAGNAAITRYGAEHHESFVVPGELIAVATLPNGNLVACGSHGALVAIVGESIVPLARRGSSDLSAITPFGTGALAVGEGGIAVRIDAKLTTTLEPVDSTTSLTAVTVSDDQTPWAGTALGRILRRENGCAWKQVACDWDAAPPVAAIWAKGNRVRAVAADGSLLMGWRLGELAPAK